MTSSRRVKPDLS